MKRKPIFLKVDGRKITSQILENSDSICLAFGIEEFRRQFEGLEKREDGLKAFIANMIERFKGQIQCG